MHVFKTRQNVFVYSFDALSTKLAKKKKSNVYLRGKSEASKRATNFVFGKTSNFLYAA